MQLQLAHVQPEGLSMAGPAAEQQPLQPVTDGGLGGAGREELQAVLASLLANHQQLVQQAAHAPVALPQLQQQPAGEQAAMPSLTPMPQHREGAQLAGSRDSSADMAAVAAAAGAAVAATPADAIGEEAAGRQRQAELAKSVAQLVVATLHRHPHCTHLKQLGAAISQALLTCVVPGGLAALAQRAPTPLRPPSRPAGDQHHALLPATWLAALLPPPAAPPTTAVSPGAGLLLHALEGTAAGGNGGVGNSGHDALLAATLHNHLQQQSLPEPPAPTGQLFRPQPVRASSGQQAAGTDQGTATGWQQLVPPAQQGGGSQVCLGDSRRVGGPAGV